MYWKLQQLNPQLRVFNMTNKEKTIQTFYTAIIFFACTSSLFAQDQTAGKMEGTAPTAERAGVANAARAESSDSPPTVAEVDAKLAEVSAATDLGEPIIASTKESLQQAKLSLLAAEKSTAQAVAYEKDTAAAPDNLIATKKELETKKAPVEPKSTSSLAEIRLQYDNTESELKDARQQSTDLSGEAARRQSRLSEIPDRLTESEQELSKLDTQLSQLADGADPALVVEARRMSLRAQRFEHRSEIASLEAERKFYTATIELLPLQNESLQRKIERLQNQSAKFKALVEEKRENEIDKLRRVVIEQVTKTPQSLQPEAEINVELVEEYVADSQQLSELGSTVEETRETLDNIKSDYKTSIERVEAVGLNETLGLMFRRSKSTLANRRRNFQPDGTLQAKIRKLQIEMFRLADLSKNASETESSISQLFDANNVAADQRKADKEKAVEILSQRREVLGQLTSTKTELYKSLVSLDVNRRKVIIEIDAYTNYINEHVLWIRSSATVGRGDLESLSGALRWITLPSNWIALGETLVQAVKKKPGLALVLGFTVFVLFLFRRRLRQSIEEAGKTAEIGSCRTFMPTAISFVNTLLIAALWPAFLLSIGWLMLNVSSQPFVQAASKSLIFVAMTIYPFEVLKQSCRIHGLGESHLGWSKNARTFIRSNLRIVVLTIPILLFLVNLASKPADRRV